MDLDNSIGRGMKPGIVLDMNTSSNRASDIDMDM